jgi:hypothetical protein
MHLQTSGEIVRGIDSLQTGVLLAGREPLKKVYHQRCSLCLSRFLVHEKWAKNSLDHAKSISELVSVVDS